MPVVTLTKANTVVADTYINENNPSSNYVSAAQLSVGNASVPNGSRTRILFKFDLGLIPNDAVINSATLTLYQTTSPAGSRTINVHKVTSAWDANTVTWASAPSFDSTVLGSRSVPNTNSTSYTFNVTNLVKEWVNNGVQNNGFLLKDSGESAINTGRTFSSFEDATNPPTLTIDYTIPSTGKKQVEYVGSTTNSANTNSQINMPIPAGVQQGDMLIAYIGIAIGSASYDIATPTGWNKHSSVTPGNGFRSSVFWKYASSSEGNVSFSISPTAITSWIGSVHAFRNVNSIETGTYAIDTNEAPSFTASGTDRMVLLMVTGSNSSATYGFPLSYSEKVDFAGGGANMAQALASRYLHEKTTLSGADLRVSPTASIPRQEVRTIVLEPITNNVPTLTLTSPTDNLSLAEGNSLPIQGSATDPDVGDVVTIRYKINNGTTRALNSGVSDGSSPISFARTLTYSNKRLWDGSTDVAGVDLAEGVDHTLTVWAEDDKQGKSAEVTRKFRVIWNRPSVISGVNEDLGTIMTPPSKTYSVAEPEGNPFTITEKINGTVIRSFEGVAGREETVTIPHDLWIRLDLDTLHTLTVEATDSNGLTSTRTYTFIRTETHIEFMLDFDNPAVEAHFTPDGMPERVLVTLELYMPQGSSIESVKVCNNALDAEPTWEDATAAVRAGRGYLFTNQTKTAEDWRINIWVIIAKGTATERVRLNGYGGAFD